MALVDILRSMRTSSSDTEIFWEDFYVFAAAAGGAMAAYSGPGLSTGNLTSGTSTLLMGTGTYAYGLTVGMANGTGALWAESVLGSTASIALGASGQVTIDLTDTVPNILDAASAVGPTRIIYRSKNGGAWSRLAIVRDPTTTSYVDTTTTPSGTTPPATSNLSIPFVGQGRDLSFPVSSLSTKNYSSVAITYTDLRPLLTTGITSPVDELWQISGVYTDQTNKSLMVNGKTVFTTTTNTNIRLRRPFIVGNLDVIRTDATAGTFGITYRKFNLAGGVKPVTAAINSTSTYTVGTGRVLVISHFYHSTDGSLIINSDGTDYYYNYRVTYKNDVNNPIDFPLIVHEDEIVKCTGTGDGTINGYLIQRPV